MPMSAIERREEIGALRSVGYEKLDIVRVMLAEAEREADGPIDRLRSFVDIYLAAETDDETAEAQRAMIDLRAQAVSQPRFRAEFTRIDDHLRDRLVDAIAEGIETGAVDDRIDPETAGTWMLATLTGAMLQRHTADHQVVMPVRRILHTRLDEFTATTDTFEEDTN